MSRDDRNPPVSLLLPNWNNEPVLDVVLQRLEANTTYPNFEVVAVDDGSTDGSLAILRRWRDTGRLPNLRLEERAHAGVVDTLNTGLRLAQGELVVQLDADASVETPGWLEKLVAFFCSDDRIGVVTGRVVIDDGRVHTYGVNLVGPEGCFDRGTTILEPVGRRTLHSRVERPLDTESRLGRNIAEVDSGMGCCMMYRRSQALEVGGYDPGFAPVWFDDLDLSLSIRRAGGKAFFLPDVLVSHRLSMRAPTERVPRRRPALHRATHEVAGRLPPRLRYAVGRAIGVEGPSPEHLERLRHHYAYWREKWGFDFLNPDTDELRARHGATEVCWASNPDMRAAGEQIVSSFQERDRSSPQAI